MKINNPTIHHLILEKAYKNCGYPAFMLHYLTNSYEIYHIIVNYNYKQDALKRIRYIEKQPQFLKWHDYESK